MSFKVLKKFTERDAILGNEQLLEAEYHIILLAKYNGWKSKFDEVNQCSKNIAKQCIGT